MRTERFQSLDGWRGLCAITVALYHLNVYGHFYAVSLLRNSWLLVDFFFVLSGFVITHAYMDRLKGWADARAFIVRRFGRLWPLHITVLAFLVGLEIVKALMAKSGATETVPAFSGAHSISSMCANIVLIHGLGLYHQFTWNVASWSISTEFYTYIVFACVLLLTRSLWVPLLAALGLLLISVVVDLRGESVPPVLAFAETVHGFFLGHLAYRLWTTGFGRNLFGSRGGGAFRADSGGFRFGFLIPDPGKPPFALVFRLGASFRLRRLGVCT